MASGQLIKANKVVSFKYSVLDAEGEILEHSDLPISYLHGGRSELLPILERHLAGHQAGDRVEVEVPPHEGFGPHDPNLTFTDDIANVPEQFRHIGAQVEMQSESGEVKTFTVSRIEGDRLTVDGNHPFAGKTVTYVLRIEEVRDPTPEELRHGVQSVGSPG